MPELPRNNFAGQVSTRLGRVSLNPRGEYAGGETYDRLDIVQYNGSGWICLKDSTTGVAPVEGDNWMRFADNGGAATVEAAQEYAEQAKASQTAAGESATAAEQSAADAETAKTGAESALSSVEAAKEAAASSATEAAGSATEAAESAQTAQEYSGNPPVIDEDTGNWKTWDAESGGYTDTGKPSRGEKGDRGEQGPPGKDGEGAGDMTADVYDPGGKATDIFGYVDSAVENVKLPANLVVSKEEEEPPAVLTVDADTLGGYGPDHYASTEYVDETVAGAVPSGDFLPVNNPVFTGSLSDTNSNFSYMSDESFGNSELRIIGESGADITSQSGGRSTTLYTDPDSNSIIVNTGQNSASLVLDANEQEQCLIKNVGAPVEGTDVPNKKYVDDTVATKQDKLTADVDYATPKYVNDKIQYGTAAPERLADGAIFLVYEE